jgi:threonine aldolase
MDLETLKEMIRPGTRQNSGTALVSMETTHNRAGGAVLPLTHMRAVHDLAREHGVPVHTDGARVFNAAIALGVDPAEIARNTDTIGFCIEGLSAPGFHSGQPRLHGARARLPPHGGRQHAAGRTAGRRWHRRPGDDDPAPA